MIVRKVLPEGGPTVNGFLLDLPAECKRVVEQLSMNGNVEPWGSSPIQDRFGVIPLCGCRVGTGSGRGPRTPSASSAEPLMEAGRPACSEGADAVTDAETATEDENVFLMPVPWDPAGADWSDAEAWGGVGIGRMWSRDTGVTGRMDMARAECAALHGARGRRALPARPDASGHRPARPRPPRRVTGTAPCFARPFRYLLGRPGRAAPAPARGR